MSETPASDRSSEGEPLTVLSGNPTADELAAVTAVISALLEEIGDDLARQTDSRPSAWQRSQVNIRPDIHPGAGAWRGFTG